MDKIPEIAYSCDEEHYYADDPEQVASDYMQENGCNRCDVFEGTPYIPTIEDEIENMEGMGWQYLIKDSKPYQSYVWDEKTQWAKQAGDE